MVTPITVWPTARWRPRVLNAKAAMFKSEGQKGGYVAVRSSVPG